MTPLEQILQLQLDCLVEFGRPEDHIRAGGIRRRLEILGWSDLLMEETIIRLEERSSLAGSPKPSDQGERQRNEDSPKHEAQKESS